MESITGTLDERVKQVSEQFGCDVSRPVEECNGWHFGEAVQPIEDDDDSGIFTGTEGILLIEKVGAAEYHNERTAFFYLEAGMDTPNEISPDNLEAIN